MSCENAGIRNFRCLKAVFILLNNVMNNIEKCIFTNLSKYTTVLLNLSVNSNKANIFHRTQYANRQRS